MAKTGLNSVRNKPVQIYPANHKLLKRLAFQCELSLERLVNSLLDKAVKNRGMLEEVLLELEIDPRCMDEMI
jgi:hypothetical protein